MESFIYGVGLTGGVVLFILFWRLRHRASAQRTAHHEISAIESSETV